MESLTSVFRCYICMEKVKDARLCPHCSKLCCLECIHRWIIDQRHSFCPHCRASLRLTELVNCRWAEEVTQQLSTLQVTVDAIARSPPTLDADICIEHKEKLCVYCCSCGDAICHQCALWDKKHSNHNFKPLDEIYKLHVIKIENQITKLKNRLIEIFSSIRSVDKNMEGIKSAKDERVKELSNAVELMITRLETSMKEKICRLTYIKRRLHREMDRLESSLQKIGSDLGALSKAETIKKSEQIMDAFAELLINRGSFTPSLVTEPNCYKVKNDKGFGLEEMSPLISTNFPSEIIPPFDSATFFIRDFPSARMNAEPLYSEPLNVSGLVWRLKLYPDGNGAVRGQYLSVFLELTSCLYAQKNKTSNKSSFNHGIRKYKAQDEDAIHDDVLSANKKKQDAIGHVKKGVVEEDGFKNGIFSSTSNFASSKYEYRIEMINQKRFNTQPEEGLVIQEVDQINNYVMPTIQRNDSVSKHQIFNNFPSTSRFFGAHSNKTIDNDTELATDMLSFDLDDILALGDGNVNNLGRILSHDTPPRYEAGVGDEVRNLVVNSMDSAGDGDFKRNIVREFASDFEVGECWGYNRFFRLALLEPEDFLAGGRTLVLRFSVRAPTFYQACRDRDRYIRCLESQIYRGSTVIKKLTTQVSLPNSNHVTTTKGSKKNKELFGIGKLHYHQNLFELNKLNLTKNLSISSDIINTNEGLVERMTSNNAAVDHDDDKAKTVSRDRFLSLPENSPKPTTSSHSINTFSLTDLEPYNINSNDCEGNDYDRVLNNHSSNDNVHFISDAEKEDYHPLPNNSNVLNNFRQTSSSVSYNSNLPSSVDLDKIINLQLVNIPKHCKNRRGNTQSPLLIPRSLSNFDELLLKPGEMGQKRIRGEDNLHAPKSLLQNCIYDEGNVVRNNESSNLKRDNLRAVSPSTDNAFNNNGHLLSINMCEPFDGIVGVGQCDDNNTYANNNSNKVILLQDSINLYVTSSSSSSIIDNGDDEESFETDPLKEQLLFKNVNHNKDPGSKSNNPENGDVAISETQRDCIKSFPLFPNIREFVEVPDTPSSSLHPQTNQILRWSAKRLLPRMQLNPIHNLLQPDRLSLDVKVNDYSKKIDCYQNSESDAEENYDPASIASDRNNDICNIQDIERPTDSNPSALLQNEILEEPLRSETPNE